MLEIKGLKKAFGSLEVLKGVDLKVNQGDVLQSSVRAVREKRRCCAVSTFWSMRTAAA